METDKSSGNPEDGFPEVNVDEIKNLCKQISSVSESIMNVCGSSENDFLKMGDQLSNIHSDTGNLVQYTQETAAIVADSGEGDIQDIINSMIDQGIRAWKTYKDDIRSKLNAIKDVNDNLIKLVSVRSQIETVAKFIRAIALNMVVESSRTPEKEETFAVISKEVKDLAEQIMKYANEVSESTENSQRHFASAHNEISAGFNELTAYYINASENVRDSLKEAGLLVSNSGILVSETGEHSAEIGKNIGSVIVGMQFHDNMRQRMEHIVKALADIKELVEKQVLPEKNKSEQLKFLGDASELFGLQVAQMKGIVRELNAVYDENKAALKNIVEKAESMSESIAVLGSNSGKISARENKSLESLNKLKSIFSEINSYADKGIDLVKNLNETSKKTSDVTRVMAAQVVEVRNINSDSHLKALNALIAADRMGDKGKTFAVLAQEMKSLANQSDVFTGEVESLINMISDTGKELWESSEKVEGRENLKDDKSVLRALEKIIETIDSFINKSSGASEMALSLKNSINSANEHLCFFIELETKLIESIKTLKEMSEVLEPYTDYISADRNGRKERLADRYTMDSERAVHMEELKEEGAVDIEQKGDNEDDNIDLF